MILMDGRVTRKSHFVLSNRFNFEVNVTNLVSLMLPKLDCCKSKSRDIPCSFCMNIQRDGE